MSKFLEIAQIILEGSDRALSAKELVQIAHEKGMIPDEFSGKTPHYTMKSKLSVHIRTRGDRSTFVRTEPGRFRLRTQVQPDSPYIAPPFTRSKTAEQALCFEIATAPRSVLRQGILSRDVSTLEKRFLTNARFTYVPRTVAETRPDVKQILTYTLVSHRGRLLCFRRGNYNRAADFLKGRLCVGFGGHTTYSDRFHLFPQDDRGIRDSAIRELSEELELPQADRQKLMNARSLRLIGFLNDDSSEVGRRHFAYIFRYEIANQADWQSPSKGEKSITQLRWIDSKAESLELWDFEYWSQLCLRAFFPAVAKAAPVLRKKHAQRLKTWSVLVVAGALGSGKSLVANQIANSIGCKVVNCGRVLAKLLNLPPVPETSREEFTEAAYKYISSSGGVEQFAKAIVREVAGTAGNRIILDGIRNESVLTEIRHILPSTRRLCVLYVHAPVDIAYLLYRKRESAGLTLEQFAALCAHPVESSVVAIQTAADWTYPRFVGARIGLCGFGELGW